MIGLVIVLLSLGIVSGLETKLRIYALPVGQGEALVLKCPSGDVTIVDMGSSDGSSSGFWNEDDIYRFFSNNFLFNKVKNIVITHNDKDHYNLIPEVFADHRELLALRYIYISRTFGELDSDLQNWINGLKSKVRPINDGNAYCCKPTDTSCLTIDLCPNGDGVKAEVLFANLGDAKKKNANSIVIRIKYGTFSVVLNGDFTDITTGKCGPGTKEELYKRMKDTTVYKLAHHGSDSDGANNDDMLSVIKPKAIFVSANPWYGNLGHPRCSRIKYLIDNKMLCKPKLKDSDYCGQHPYHRENILQEEYTCCHNQQDCPLISMNEYAIYSTAPAEHMINLIELVTDGTKWGFINTPQLKKPPIIPPTKAIKKRPRPKKPKPKIPNPKKPIRKKPKTGRRNSEPSPLLRRLMPGIWESQ